MIIATDCVGRAMMDQHGFGFIRGCIKTAKEEGLEVWIFDDWGYPSGTAGGLVCTNDSFRAKT